MKAQIDHFKMNGAFLYTAENESEIQIIKSLKNYQTSRQRNAKYKQHVKMECHIKDVKLYPKE